MQTVGSRGGLVGGTTCYRIGHQAGGLVQHLRKPGFALAGVLPGSRDSSTIGCFVGDLIYVFS